MAPNGGIHYIETMSWTDQHPDMAGAFAAVAEAKFVEQKAFREAMSRLGAAVHVITTDGPSGKTGFTATAVCSVSDAPPTLLVCLNRGATSMPILRGNGVLTQNTPLPTTLPAAPRSPARRVSTPANGARCRLARRR